MNISKLIRSEGITDYCVILRQGNKITVQGPITPEALETALILMGKHSPKMRAAINRARTKIYEKGIKNKQQ